VKSRTAPRLAWLLWSLGAAGFVAFSVIELTGTRTTNANAWFNAQEAVGALVFPTVGALIASRRKDNAIGWLFLVLGVSFAVSAVSGAVNDTAAFGTDAWQWGEWGLTWSWVPGWVIMVTFLLVLFPDGRLPSTRWRWVGWLAGIGIALATLAGMSDPTAGGTLGYQSPMPTAPESVAGTLMIAGSLCVLAAMAGALAALVGRFRRSTGDERLQMKWFVVAGIATVVLIPARTVVAVGSPILLVIGLASIPIPPVATGVAILRYRLYEIDVVINKTVVYAALAAFITAVYVAIVVGVGALLGSGDRTNVPLSIAATAVVAVAFQPVRERVQRFANRLVYGERATPYEVLSRFSERLSGTFATEDLLPRMAHILAEGTGAERADVWLLVGDSLRTDASWPPEVTALTPVDVATMPDHLVPVRYQDRLLGALSIDKGSSEPSTPAETKLVNDLASQAGLVLRNVGLTEELRARLEDLRTSRQRIVAAQDQERRKLERDIHDGAQQQLVALTVKLRLAEQLAQRDVTKAHELLAQLQTETGEALENLRDLARGIYPPLLADKGLVAALESQARRSSIPVSVRGNDIGRYREETEAAVYFCCLEALQNVAKYANASRAEIGLANGGGLLTFTITDDGDGFDPGRTGYGTGLQGMADRLAALDGTLQVTSSPGEGTTADGRLPVATVGGDA
jgi:signal transduction histidine kinase